MQAFTIRVAAKADVPALAALITELGYPTTPDEMAVRFEDIAALHDYRTYVAIAANVVAGMIGLSKNHFYEHNGVYIRVAALVVHPGYRKQGIGKALMQTAEDWAKETDATAILLNSGQRKEREAAHTFYLQLGYEPKSTGFVKKPDWMQAR